MMGKRVGMDVNSFSRNESDVCAARCLLDRHGGRLGQSQGSDHNQVGYFHSVSEISQTAAELSD